MIDLRHHARLALEALGRAGREAELGRQHLEGHHTPQPHLDRLEHDRHPAARQLVLDLVFPGEHHLEAVQQVVAARGRQRDRRVIRIAHERATVPAEPGRRRDVRPALEALHGRTLIDWARVGALSVTMELSSRIMSVAAPMLLAASESRPAVRSKTLVSDDHIVRRGRSSGVPPASTATLNGTVLSRWRTESPT